MGDIRKLIASAVTGGDLSESEITETNTRPSHGVRHRGHLFAAGHVAVALKYANDHREYEPALALLTRQVRRPNQVLSFMRKLCQCVLNEWLDELCRKCGGRGHIIAEGTPHARQTCSDCDGTGVRRPSELHRMNVMGLTPKSYPKWEARFSSVYAVIVEADDAATESAARQLGRRVNRSSVTRKVLALHTPCGIVGSSSRPAHNDNSMPDEAIGSVVGA
jgi:hypothetical protein